MFKINLVPEVQEEKQKVKKINTMATAFAITIIGLCIFALLVLSGLLLAKNSELSSTKKEIVSTEGEIAKYKELEETVVSLEQGLAGARQILDGENRWTKLLFHLEKATPGDVQFIRLKLTNDKIEADLKGQNINSLARFSESFKEYKVISLSGPGEQGESVNITIDGGPAEAAMVKTNGRWIYAANFDPAKDHEIAVDVGENKKETIKYKAADKKIESDTKDIQTETKNLFSEVETNQYDKKDNMVEFKTTFKFNGSLIW